MSNSMELILLRREVAISVLDTVEIDDSPLVEELVEQGLALESARQVVLQEAAGVALIAAKGDTECAKTALVIVNAETRRLPHCVRLLGRHNEAIVRVAYRMHEHLNDCSCSIVHICRVIETLGYIPEDDDNEIVELLNDIAARCISLNQMLFWLYKLPELIRRHGLMLDATRDYVLSAIEHGHKLQYDVDEFDRDHEIRQLDEAGLITVDKETLGELWESQISYDQEDQ